METAMQSLKFRVKKILRDWVFISLVLAGLLLVVGDFLVVKFFLDFDQPSFIFHYNVFFGIDGISFDAKESFFKIMLALLGGGVVWLLNFILAFLLYLASLKEREKSENNWEDFDNKETDIKKIYPRVFASYLLVGGSLFVISTVSVYVFSLILINN